LKSKIMIQLDSNSVNIWSKIPNKLTNKSLNNLDFKIQSILKNETNVIKKHNKSTQTKIISSKLHNTLIYLIYQLIFE
jgi:hypothetical protein